MGHLRYVTLTGADMATSLTHLDELSKQYPFIEWGVLYSPGRAGLENRYPTLEWLEAFADHANQRGWNIALHLCGPAVHTVRNAVAERRLDSDAEASRLVTLAAKFGRVQLNVRAKASDLQAYKSLITWLHRNERRTRVILQWNAANSDMCAQLSGEYGFEILVDSSGGRGISPSQWPLGSDLPARKFAYAGGLGPDNIEEQLPLIEKASGHRMFGVDMEGKLRDDADLFDWRRCTTIAQAAARFIAEQCLRASAVHGKGHRAVATLSGQWLDWWLGHLSGEPVAMLEEDSTQAVLLLRREGEYSQYSPSQSAAEATRLISMHRIGLTPEADGSWTAKGDTFAAAPMHGNDMLLTGLRAVVSKHLGTHVPCDPCGG